MTNFAKIENEFVTQIIVAEQDVIDSDLFGDGWVLASESPEKGCVAFIGCKYDQQNNVFYAVNSFLSWTFNQEKFIWEPPTPMPTDGKQYTWDESTTSWKQMEMT